MRTSPLAARASDVAGASPDRANGRELERRRAIVIDALAAALVEDFLSEPVGSGSGTATPESQRDVVLSPFGELPA